MSEFQLNNNNHKEAYDWVLSLLNEGPYHILTAKNPAIGKWTMTRLWRSWMASTANEMESRGVTVDIKNSKGQVIGTRKYNENDAHEMFTFKYLTDSTGKRLSWSKKGRDGMRQADRGERVFAMQNHQQWMLERNISHICPNDSDYKRAIQEQNK